jgi:hypothetical protein
LFSIGLVETFNDPSKHGHSLQFGVFEVSKNEGGKKEESDAESKDTSNDELDVSYIRDLSSFPWFSVVVKLKQESKYEDKVILENIFSREGENEELL